jgi:hypothetical protein
VSHPDILGAFVERHFRRHPVTASFTGVTAYDHHLPDWTRAGREDARREISDLRRSLDAAPPISDAALAAAALDIEAAELDALHFHRRNPCLYTAEATFGVIALMLRHHAPPDERAAAMVTRLATISSFLDAASVSLDQPAPGLWIDRAVAECTAARNLFLAGLDVWSVEEGVSESLRADLNAVGAAAAVALAGFAGWLEAEPRDENAGSGADHLTLLLRKAHWRTESPHELLEQMYADLERATTAWRSSAPGDAWPDVRERLAQRHPVPDQYLARFQETWAVSRSTALQHDLLTWPDFPIEYRQMPQWARAAAPHLYFLFYRSPPVVDGPAVHRYLVPAIDGEPPDAVASVLRATNDWVIKSNHVVHHGGIGHHVQNTRARNGQSLIGRVAGIDGAARLALPCAGTLAEGWACYATDVMAEYGFFTEDQLIAHQHAQVRQVARGIVDIELHMGRRTLTEAIAFLAGATEMPEAAARREVTRTSMFPGTGLLYWLGTTTLHAVRRDLEPRYGSLRAFHDRVLRDGSVPVALIRERMSAEGAR